MGNFSSSSPDSEVSNDSICSKSCLKTVELLKSQNDQLLKDLKKSELMVLGYKTGLELVEEKLEVYKANESIYLQDIKGLKWEIHIGEITIRELMKKLEIVQKEKDGIQFNVDKFEHASKSLNKLIECQIVDNCKKGLSYENYNAVPPPYTRNFMPPTPDLSFTGLDEFVNKPVVENCKAMSSKEEPKNLVPRAGLMKSGLESINTARQNISKTAVLVNTARQVNVAQSKTIVNAARPMSYLSKTAHSTIKSPIHQNTTFKNNNINQKVNTVIGSTNCSMVLDSGGSRQYDRLFIGLGEYNWVTLSSPEVYYVEGLKHNLFSVGRFGMGKISSNIGYETPQVIEKFIVKTQRALNATVRFVRTDNGTEFNGVVERRNRTLMEAARTMLIFAKAPLFLWAEAVATACYTLNRSLCLDLVLPTNDYDDVGQTQGESRYRYICWSIAPSMKAYESTINERKVSGNVHVALMRFTEGVKSVQTSQARLKKDFCAKQSELELIAFTVRTQRSA
ncbi:putative ribonuclease H-like domain-containing protein [Tanacetum coccineum]